MITGNRDRDSLSGYIISRKTGISGTNINNIVMVYIDTVI